MQTEQPPAQRGSGRTALGVAIVGFGLVLLLDTLGVEIPWRLVLPAGVMLVGIVLLLNPRVPAGGWIVLGGILTVAMVSAGFGNWSFGDRTADNVERAGFTVSEEVDLILVRVDNGSVEILAVPGATGVEVERVLNFNDERPEVDHATEGGVLTVDSDCPGGFFGSSCWVDHVFRVPESVDVEIDAGSGSVRVSGISGDVQADTGSGVIDLVDLSGRISADSGSGGVVLEGVTGPTDVSTGSGTIKGGNLGSTSLTAGTGSGSINLSFTVAPESLDLETGSGSVTVDVPAGPYRLDLDTSSGSVRSPGITDDPAAPRTIVVRTGSGSIRVTGS